MRNILRRIIAEFTGFVIWFSASVIYAIREWRRRRISARVTFKR